MEKEVNHCSKCFQYRLCRLIGEKYFCERCKVTKPRKVKAKKSPSQYKIQCTECKKFKSTRKDRYLILEEAQKLSDYLCRNCRK